MTGGSGVSTVDSGGNLMSVPTSKSNRFSSLARFRRRNRSEVSAVIKYIVFFFNIIFWLLGAVLIGVGVWAAVEKNVTSNISTLSSLILDPVKVLIISGCIIFVIGFFGCVGALRENTCLLLAYIVCVFIILLLLIVAAILVFACKDWLKAKIWESSLNDVIPQYRDDPDLQNLIDWAQSEWLHCCGLKDYNDWQRNIYFNCSSPGSESCGVPYSCCLSNSSELSNLACGYRVLRNTDPSKVIYTKGCIDRGEAWFDQYLIPIAGTTVAVGVVLMLCICFAWNLRSDINAQKAKWYRLNSSIT